MTNKPPFQRFPKIYINCDGRKHPEIDALEVIPMDDGTFVLFPHYSLTAVPEGWCAGYAKRVVNKLFGRSYEYGPPAWDMRYKHKTIPVTDLRTQYDEGILIPGDILGVFNPHSELNIEKKDCYGLPIQYSHMASFLGEDIWGDLRFGEQIISLRRTASLQQMQFEGFDPREIIKDMIIIR